MDTQTEQLHVASRTMTLVMTLSGRASTYIAHGQFMHRNNISRQLQGKMRICLYTDVHTYIHVYMSGTYTADYDKGFKGCEQLLGLNHPQTQTNTAMTLCL